jgi:hypothetical protein
VNRILLVIVEDVGRMNISVNHEVCYKVDVCVIAADWS